MKKLLALLIFLTAVGFVQSQSCNDLIVSEIIFGNVSLSTENTTQLNHSVEVFNPTDAPIDLSHYRIELISESGATTIVDLSGIVPSRETFVISNLTANTGITNMSDAFDILLSFDGKVALNLAKTTGEVIDNIGRKGVDPTSEIIDLGLYLNDPNYLSTFDINLGSLENLLIKRKGKIQQGNLAFQNEDLEDEWIILPNFQIGDLGDHLNACIAAELNWENYNWVYPELTVTEGGFSGTLEGTVEISGTLNASVKVFVVDIFHEFLDPPNIGHAEPFFDYTFDTFNSTTIPAFSSQYEIDLCTIVDDNEVEQDEGVGFWLIMEDENNTGSYIGFDDIFDILIRDDDVSAVSEIDLNDQIQVFPTIVDRNLNIKSLHSGLVIEEVILVSIDSKERKRARFMPSPDLALDLGFLSATGYYSLLIKTNKGIVSKKIIKK